jgi:GNAT superfamily N-acetyltransferase
MSDSPRVRPAQPDDVEELMSLIEEFAGFERLEGVLGINTEKLGEVLFSDSSYCRSIVVEHMDELIGYSFFYPIFRTFSGKRCLYLEDLFIKPDHRGKGLGRELLLGVTEFALGNGFERVDFQVLDWNDRAVAFYSGLGATRVSGNLDFSISEQALKNLVNEKARS